jgi:outer membrane protein assembly factor BamA
MVYSVPVLKRRKETVHTLGRARGHLRNSVTHMDRRLVLSLVIAALLGAFGYDVVRADPGEAEQDTTITDWTILPVMFHTPETGTGGGVAGAYFFKDRVEARPSSIQWISFYTEKKQTILTLSPDLYFSGSSRRLHADVEYRDYPDVFYGIGSGTHEDEEEDYREKAFEMEASYEVELWRNLRIGPILGFRRSHVTEVEEDGKLASGRIPGVEKHRRASVGLVLVHDGRDNILYPTRGSYLRVSTNYSGDATGSDYRYSRHTLDLRHFLGFASRQVIGLRAHFAAAEGSPPFQALPVLGGDKMMRGFTRGRFRDKLACVGQAEYRLKIKWRVGFAAFAALGAVAGDIDGFTESKMRFSGGAGIRFRLNDEGLNLRLDIGFTEEGSGFYFIAGEAF